jgi:hypothetical protein
MTAAISAILLAVAVTQAQTMSAASASGTSETAAVAKITLQDAIARAEANDPSYATSVTDAGLNREYRR